MIAVQEQQQNPIDYFSYFNDARLEDRGNAIASAILTKETVILNQLADTRADVVGHGRFFQNDRVSLSALQEEAIRRCAEQAQGLDVLVIGDTSELNYQRHVGKLSQDDVDLGPVGNNRDIGFFLHPMLVVDAHDGFPLGFSDLYTWNRSWEKLDKHERAYQTLPIEEKESYRWIACGQRTQEVLSHSARLTIIYDREADIYEEFVVLPDAKTHLLVRSTQNRCLHDQPEKLFEHLSAQPSMGTYPLEIPKGHSKRQGRSAEIEVRVTRVRLSRPMNAANKTLPAWVELTAIEAKECASSVPAGESPIRWRLLTTHEVTTFAEAMTMITWYRWRWLIEQVFRTLKSQGLNVEQSQLETGAGLKKMALMSATAALRIMQLTLDRDGKAGKPGTLAFSETELDCLVMLGTQYEGKTLRQQNPYQIKSLAWTAWIIGRIGGWKGYQKAGPAGPITIKRGLEKFNHVFTGWLLQTMCASKDVCIE